MLYTPLTRFPSKRSSRISMYTEAKPLEYFQTIIYDNSLVYLKLGKTVFSLLSHLVFSYNSPASRTRAHRLYPPPCRHSTPRHCLPGSFSAYRLNGGTLMTGFCTVFVLQRPFAILYFPVHNRTIINVYATLSFAKVRRRYCVNNKKKRYNTVFQKSLTLLPLVTDPRLYSFIKVFIFNNTIVLLRLT